MPDVAGYLIYSTYLRYVTYLQVVLPMLEEEFVSRTGYSNTTVGGSLGTQVSNVPTYLLYSYLLLHRARGQSLEKPERRASEAQKPPTAYPSSQGPPSGRTT